MERWWIGLIFLVLLSCEGKDGSTDDLQVVRPDQIHHTDSLPIDDFPPGRLNSVSSFDEEEVFGVFLTCKSDPVRSMVVDWHSSERPVQYLYFRLEGSRHWFVKESQVFPFPHSSPQRWIHRVELEGLRANSKYYFRVDDGEKEYYFKTLPENLDKTSVRIAIGGDTMHKQVYMEKTSREAMKYNPDLIVIGGDLAYCDGVPENVGRWYDWFEAYNNAMVAEDGRVVPLIVAIGNHEVVGGSYNKHNGFVSNDESRASIAPYFFGLFAFPGQPGYGVLDVGDYLSIFLLDSEHANPIVGPQIEWLDQELSKRKEVLHLIPVYHVPAFPSVKDYDGVTETQVRKNFVPLFEKYGVKLAFENHDHAYKRTHPILKELVDQDGITYVGDGSWGTNPREVLPADSTWYLEKSQSVRAFNILNLDGKQFSLIGVDEDGEVIDIYPELPLVTRPDGFWLLDWYERLKFWVLTL